jgi:hypothetical protein
MRYISKKQWYAMLDRNCSKGKHRLRVNKYGVTWCVVCGLLSNKTGMAELSDDDRLLIVGDAGDEK